MYRLTKNYFRSVVLVAVGLCVLFLTWQLGILFGRVSVRYSRKLDGIVQLDARKNADHRNEVFEPAGSNFDAGETETQDSKTRRHFTERDKKINKVIELSIKETTKAMQHSRIKQTKRKLKKKKKKKERNHAINPTKLLETRNSQKEVRTNFVISQITIPTPLAVPQPVTIQNSWSNVYGESGCSPNPWRTILVELFTKWVKIAKKHDIEYILFYGSLLGALRTGDVIPYDSDIDLLMDVKYFPKMKEIAVKRGFDISDGKIRLVVQPEFDYNVSSNARKRYTCKGQLTPNMVDGCSFQEPLGRLVKTYLHIDFYHFYDKGNHLEDPSEEDVKTYDKNDMFPLRPCKFMGLETSCPNKPWKLLKQYFHSNDLESKYKCKNKQWVDKNGKPPF